MFAYKSIECLHQLLKKLTSVYCSISLNPYNIISNLESRKKKKESNSIVLAYIADVSCLTNRSFYMRTLSLNDFKKEGSVQVEV